MRKLVIGIFAHPDDETFGPGGSLALYAKQGAEVHIITVTDGSLGGSDPDLINIRRKELESAVKILGLNSNHHLNFIDGGLSNDKYQDVLQSLIETIRNIVGKDEAEVSFITLEQSGLTGHLDHIAVSMITTCLYQKLDQYIPGIKQAELQYFCITDIQRPKSDKTYFVYCPCGCPAEDIDIVKDVSPVIDIKKRAIRAFVSQQHDVDRLLTTGDKLLATENFKIYKEKF
jgi:LmbE family N-acetylglucosaminyl deacetylase